MPDEVGSGGEQIVATPAIENSLDAVQQAAFDECMRNRANQVPGDTPINAEAECLRVASQVNLTNESSSGDALQDQVIESHSAYMQECQQEFGKSAEECEKLWKTYAGQISTAKVLVGDAKDHEGGTLEHCVESAKLSGLSQEEAEAKCKQMMSIDAKDQDLAQAARNYPNTSEGYQSFLADGCGHGDVEDCVQAWEQTYGSRFDTRFDKPTVGVSHDKKVSWVAHKDRPYTKKPKQVV